MESETTTTTGVALGESDPKPKPQDFPWDVDITKIQKAGEQLAAMQAKQLAVNKTPTTIKENGMNQYQAAQELRIIAKGMYHTDPFAMEHALSKLSVILNKPQSKKAERLAALDELSKAIETYKKGSQDTISRIKLLVQHLPTVPNLPDGRAENIVRAFVAILKTNGMVTT